MIIETLKSFIAFGILGFIIGSFLYKTYKAIRNDPQKPSPWKRIQATVLSSRITESFSYGKKGMEVDLEYVIDGKRYSGTGQSVLYRNEEPPKTVELVYKPEAPEAWEWAADHNELESDPTNSRFVIFFIWLLIILIGGCVVVAVYFPDLVRR
jgi:hypothetical protein